MNNIGVGTKDLLSYHNQANAAIYRFLEIAMSPLVLLLKHKFCQAQGPTPGPIQGLSRSRSQHGWFMVRSGQTTIQTQKWYLSFTLKLVFTRGELLGPLRNC